MRPLIYAAVLALCVGCTGTPSKKNADNADPNNGNGATNGGTTNGATDGGNNSTSPCPDTQPSSGPCDSDGLRCQYGDDPRMECRPIATCTDDGWSVEEPACEDPPEAECPPTREDASGEVCDTMDAYCTYDQGLDCHCTNCVEHPVEMCGGDPTWRCEAPNADESCPAAMPNLGKGCDVEGTKCEYECGAGGARTCTDGVWVEADGGGCPISSRRAKTNIRYLSDAQVEAISRRLMQMKLARYEYVDPTIADGEQLGFIIEDDPQSPAVDARGNMVDLYGYASMLAADAQAKGERIEQLEERLGELERRMEQLETPRCDDRSHPPD